MLSEPADRGRLDAAHLLLVDHFQRMPEPTAALLLDLHHEQTATAPQDEVDLVPADARVGLEEPVAAKPVVVEGAALAAVHAASTEA